MSVVNKILYEVSYDPINTKICETTLLYRRGALAVSAVDVKSMIQYRRDRRNRRDSLRRLIPGPSLIGNSNAWGN